MTERSVIPSRHVAIVSFGYPPLAHVSGTRASRMARELTARGHEVTVATVDWCSNGESVDDGGARVIRIDPRTWFPEFDPTARPLQIEAQPALAAARRLRTAMRTIRWGPFAPWARAAVGALIAAHRRRAVEIVWAIHGDDSAHEIAFRFHRATGVPWVADFKDPWDQFHPRGLYFVQKAVTARRLHSARSITCTAREQSARDEVTFGRSIDVIWTSYDHEGLAAARPERSSDAFSMLYVGHFGEKHDVGALIGVLSAVHARSGGRRVEFHVYGHANDSFRKQMRAAGIEEMLVSHGFVPQARAHALMRGADALIFLPTTNHQVGVAVGVKELEYFASGSPVICVGSVLPEMQPIVEGLRSVVQAPTVAAAAEVLLEELEAFAAGQPSSRRGPVNPSVLMAHTWPEKALALERVLFGVQ